MLGIEKIMQNVQTEMVNKLLQSKFEEGKLGSIVITMKNGEAVFSPVKFDILEYCKFAKNRIKELEAQNLTTKENGK